MLKVLMTATAALTLMSGLVLADDVGTTETTRQSTGVGPLKFEIDKTVRHDSSEGVRMGDQTRTEKEKTVTKDWDGDTTSKSKTETTTVR
jgi:hypothetical protein